VGQAGSWLQEKGFWPNPEMHYALQPSAQEGGLLHLQVPEEPLGPPPFVTCRADSDDTPDIYGILVTGYSKDYNPLVS
jgi:hypothetical protein